MYIPSLILTKDPFTAIHLDSIGSNISDYRNSLQKLIRFISERESELSGAPVTPSQVSLEPPKDVSPSNEHLIQRNVPINS